MPKAEKGTPKDIAKQIKAKGLQKLKFYCQMCHKQCRDANGFKCHLTSESHLRNMKVFSENASGIMDNMSREFEKTYLDTLRRRHGTKRVNANNVYQEVIQDKHHIHMNATKWPTLGIFVQYLGRTGKCVVDETERGWYVQYIERDASILARQEALEKRMAAEQAAEERLQQQLELQRVEAAKALDRVGAALETEATALQRNEDDFKVALNLGSTSGTKKKSNGSITQGISVFGAEADDDEEDDEDRVEAKESMPASLPITELKKRARDDKIDDTKEDRISKHSKKQGNESLRTDNWLCKDILVRIISKRLDKYYKRKAVVDEVLDKYTAEVEVLDSAPDANDGGDVLRLDQDDLETVIPKEGKYVRILNGSGRGEKAKVLSLNPKKYRATLELQDGTILEKVDYNDISKIA